MSTLDERKAKSFDVVLDTLKLLISLSTAIIGYLATIILVPANENHLEAIKIHSCGVTWAMFLLAGCVLFGVLTILKITGILGNTSSVTNGEVSIYNPITRTFFSLSLMLFLTAIIILGFVTRSEISHLP